MKNAALWVIAGLLGVAVVGAGAYWALHEYRTAQAAKALEAAQRKLDKTRQAEQILYALKTARGAVEGAHETFERSRRGSMMLAYANASTLALLYSRVEQVPGHECFELARTKSMNSIKQMHKVLSSAPMTTQDFADAMTPQLQNAIDSGVDSAFNELRQACNVEMKALLAD